MKPLTTGTMPVKFGMKSATQEEKMSTDNERDYPNRGVLFKNDRKESDKHPDYGNNILRANAARVLRARGRSCS